MWEGWAQRSQLEWMVGPAIMAANMGLLTWKSVAGPAHAFFATARRIGWQVLDACTMRSDRG